MCLLLAFIIFADAITTGRHLVLNAISRRYDISAFSVGSGHPGAALLWLFLLKANPLTEIMRTLRPDQRMQKSDRAVVEHQPLNFHFVTTCAGEAVRPRPRGVRGLRVAGRRLLNDDLWRQALHLDIIEHSSSAIQLRRTSPNRWHQSGV